MCQKLFKTAKFILFFFSKYETLPNKFVLFNNINEKAKSDVSSLLQSYH